MADTGTQSQVDVSTIPDPDVRRALRAMVQLNHQLGTRLQQQQQEIEALLQMMCEKHVGSVGEFKRHMHRLQTADARSERIHDQIATATAAPTTQMRMPEIVESDGDRPRRYTL
jgi:hypothetical protein